MHASQTSPRSGELEPPPDAETAPILLHAGLSPWCFSLGKRLVDFLIASVATLMLWPVMLAVAAAIKLSSPGPVLFRQKRVGENGRTFELFKFRSMCIDASRSGPGVTCRNDPRIFPLGRQLRKWKLDELPQLFNVLRGEMSLVGPRPDLPEFCATLSGSERLIFDLRPGITSCASLHYRHEEEVLASRQTGSISEYYIHHLYPEKVRMDLDYASRASLIGDLQILVRTFAAIFS